MQFLWENDSATKFKDILRSPDLEIFIRDFSEDDIPYGDVNTSLPKVENMLISAAKRCLRIIIIIIIIIIITIIMIIMKQLYLNLLKKTYLQILTHFTIVD